MAEKLVDFLSREIDVGPSVIGRGILPVHSKLVLAGQPKTNKSFLVLNIGLGLASGMHLFNGRYQNGAPAFPVTRAHRVLYLELEVGEKSLQTRLGGMVKPEAAALLPFFVKARDVSLRLDSQEGISMIEREIEQAQAEVVMFDPLAQMHSLDENSSADMGRIMRVGDFLIQKHGITIIYVHHTGLAALDPASYRRGGARLRGSSAIFAAVDSVIEVTRKSPVHAAEPLIELNFELRHGEPLRPHYVTRRLNGIVEFHGEEPPGARQVPGSTAPKAPSVKGLLD